MRGKQYNVTDIMAILWLIINFGQKSCGLIPEIEEENRKRRGDPMKKECIAMLLAGGQGSRLFLCFRKEDLL
jgi:hypothetical protein